MLKKTNAQRELGTYNSTKSSAFSIAHDERINLELCSGYDAYHSNEPGAKNPKPYEKITLDDISQLVKARLIIPLAQQPTDCGQEQRIAKYVLISEVVE